MRQCTWCAVVAWWVFVAACAPGLGAEPSLEPLWPAGAPGARGNAPGDQPSLTYFLPEKRTAGGAAVVICPGGAYSHLATDHEGDQVARWLNSFGVTGVVLRYRHNGSGYRHPVPLQDAQRALSTVRSKAESLRIRPDRIGVLGFSAGGHLASTLGTHFYKGLPDAPDPIDRVSCRPDFMVLVYPVITLTDPFTHRGSRQNLLGDQPEPSLVDLLSNEKQVTSDTPPTFLIHGGADTGVPLENSLSFYSALRKAGVPAELHIFRQGRHGFGLGAKDGQVSVWPRLCEQWMRTMGWVASAEGQGVGQS
ncbi:MAG: alpha/beta hydrolase [Phycisphaerae bacterium]|nr:alpha/beta hydrolase [Phycisphaerae bacterium]